jgi:hypothetical protein
MSTTEVLQRGPETATGGGNDLAPPKPPGDYLPENGDDDNPGIQEGISAIETMLAEAAAKADSSDVNGHDHADDSSEYGRGYHVESVTKRVVPVIGGIAAQRVSMDRSPEQQLVMPLSYRRRLGRASLDPGVAAIYSNRRAPQWGPI